MWIGWLNSEDELGLGKEMEKHPHKYNVINSTFTGTWKVSKARHTPYRKKT